MDCYRKKLLQLVFWGTQCGSCIQGKFSHGSLPFEPSPYIDLLGLLLNHKVDNGMIE